MTLESMQQIHRQLYQYLRAKILDIISFSNSEKVMRLSPSESTHLTMAEHSSRVAFLFPNLLITFCSSEAEIRPSRSESDTLKVTLMSSA
ncbi:hypothetical protein Mapa_010301 [Marchantia paleacea]|nr:hypothetical protein Mapa_010301 [Marchantia paleacea]